jgi:hypothetical protein
MYLATVAREMDTGESETIHKKYLSQMEKGIEEANFKYLLNLLVEVVLLSLSGFFIQRFVNEEFDQSAHLKRSLADRLFTLALDKYTRYYLSQAERIMKNFRYYRKTHDLKELAEAASKATSLANHITGNGLERRLKPCTPAQPSFLNMDAAPAR